MARGFWGGFAEGVNEHLQNTKGADKEKALMLLKGIMEGNVTQKTPEELQTKGIRPPNIGQKIMSGFGLTPSSETDLSRYNIMPSMERESKMADIEYKTAQAKHLQETTPSYIAEKQAEIENAKQNLELRKQEIANDVNKTTQQKTLETQRLDLEKNKLDLEERKFKTAQGGILTPVLRKQKIKDTSELTNIVSRNANTRQYVNEALNAVDKIPQGAGGLMRRKGMEWFDPKNPVLGEWQKIKSVLSDIQLGKLQFTKGAISNYEMEFFANAVANNNIASAPRIKLILSRALNDLDTDEEAKKKAYLLNYGEDPDDIFDRQLQPTDEYEQMKQLIGQ